MDSVYLSRRQDKQSQADGVHVVRMVPIHVPVQKRLGSAAIVSLVLLVFVYVRTWKL